MAQIHNLEIECKARSCEEKLYVVLIRDVHMLPKYVPQLIHSIQVLPGDREVHVGTVLVSEYVQEKITAVDHKNMSVTSSILEGDLKNDYTSIGYTLTITPLQRDGNYNFLVRWSVYYEKANEDVPDPTYFMKLLEDLTKELDTNLLKEE
ncbi:MLP-like protein 43 [Papaver somniferum]|uniref:MLP-like protein 43 n=1 Tax=Papaver somniferum TaxID=3469 RepID=UPI000E703465|nr:MLP-like protein 43 [Papaver somniferum]